MSDQITTFSVPDMHCPSCPKLIRVSLSETVGVNTVSASLETKSVTVSFDPAQVSQTGLINVIKEIGYSAQVIN